MVTAWMVGWMRNITEQKNYMKSILWAYANNKIKGPEEAQKALEIIETWEGNDGSPRGTSS